MLLSWIPPGKMPYNPTLSAVVDFIHQTTDPYLNFFRRFLPPIKGGGMMFDLSPIIAIILLLDRAGDRRRPDRGLSRCRDLVRGLLRLRGRRRARPGLEGDRRVRASPAGEHVEVLPFLDITNSRNCGVAFGLADGVSPAIIGAGLVLLLGLIAYLGAHTSSGWAVWLAGGLLIGGAVSNLIDRVARGSVVDFIDFSFWPTFNLADVAIVVGVGLLVLAPLREP